MEKEEKIPVPVVFRRAEHCLSRKNMDPDALKVMQRLHRHGYKAYLVGGSVRDLLLGRTPKDFDVSTDARPGQIRRLFNNCRIIGRRFRLAHIYFRGNKIIEVSTFRKTPPVEAGREEDAADTAGTGDNTFGLPHEDALRRDLTINALFYDIGTFSILDYVGGMEDLRAGVLRTIGPPDESLQEDPIRMIRIVRHAVRTGFGMEPATRAGILRNAHLLQGSNRFRLQDEFQKDLEGPAFGSVLNLQSEMGLLAVIFPELDVYLKEFRETPQALFGPSWVWNALARLDASTEEKDLVTERRVMSLLVPLLEHRATRTFPSLPEAIKDPVAIKEILGDVRPPFAVRRREQERFRTYLSSWMRIREFVEERHLIPASYTNKAYFQPAREWYVFYRTICADPEEAVRERLQAAVEAGRMSRGRPRRKRKKRLRYRRKAPDFS
jgi:poly(A) polymerase